MRGGVGDGVRREVGGFPTDSRKKEILFHCYVDMNAFCCNYVRSQKAFFFFLFFLSSSHG